MVGTARLRKPVLGLIAVVILACAAILLYSWHAHRQASKAPAHAAASQVPVPAAPAIQNPVPQTAPSAQPLPALADSDAPVHEALGGLIGAAAIDRLLKPDMLVRHLVVTIDNLSRKHAAAGQLPNRPVPGKFMAKGDDQHGTLDPDNYQRYTPYVQALQMVDVKSFASMYFHFYPLFQQAYQNLGYPNGYFNDRLVETIDNLLQTPDIKGGVALVRPNVMYQFADPMLENLSAGQKVLLRMGPENEAAVKAKLKELRAGIADRSRSRDRNTGGG